MAQHARPKSRYQSDDLRAQLTIRSRRVVKIPGSSSPDVRRSIGIPLGPCGQKLRLELAIHRHLDRVRCAQDPKAVDVDGLLAVGEPLEVVAQARLHSLGLGKM